MHDGLMHLLHPAVEHKVKNEQATSKPTLSTWMSGWPDEFVKKLAQATFGQNEYTTFTEVICPKCVPFMQFSKKCTKWTIPQQAKIRPIWSPWYKDRMYYQISSLRLLYRNVRSFMQTILAKKGCKVLLSTCKLPTVKMLTYKLSRHRNLGIPY
jgi:hypothetical protein